MEQEVNKTDAAALKQNPPRNSFSWSEWSGAFGDLGVSLPILAALAFVSGFFTAQILLLWGLVYIAVGLWFRVPVSVQPLKAMAVLTLVNEYMPVVLSAAAVIYGLLFVVLARSGLIERLNKFMRPALIRGVQLGIGLLLAVKAWDLAHENGWLLQSETPNWWLNTALLPAIVLLIWFVQFKRGFKLTPILIGGAMLVALINGVELPSGQSGVNAFGGPTSTLERLLSQLTGSGLELGRHLDRQAAQTFEAVLLLIVTQLPLTLGNAVYAADETAHDLWPERSGRVNPTSLAQSIGLANVGIGFLGGFPVCHGAGGMAAHAQFGARTGGAAIIIGAVFIATALVDPLRAALLAIPVVLLAALLLFDAARMIAFVRRLDSKFEVFVACLIGLLSLLTKNLMIALAAGGLLLILRAGLRGAYRKTHN